MNQAQEIVRHVYDDGAFEYLDDPSLSGDTLFKFLMIELSDEEDCEDMGEAIRRIEVAIRQIEAVQQALEAALP